MTVGQKVGGIGRARDTHGRWEIGISVRKAEEKEADYDRIPRCCVARTSRKTGNLA